MPSNLEDLQAIANRALAVPFSHAEREDTVQRVNRLAEALQALDAAPAPLPVCTPPDAQADPAKV